MFPAVYNVSPSPTSPGNEAERQLQLEIMGTTYSKSSKLDTNQLEAGHADESVAEEEEEGQEDKQETRDTQPVGHDLEAAVKSANLLNAARQTARHVSETVSTSIITKAEPIKPPPDESTTKAAVPREKLKRPTFMAQNLNRVAKPKTRRDPYELSFSSPEQKKAPVRALRKTNQSNASRAVPSKTTNPVLRNARAGSSAVPPTKPVGKRENLRSTRSVSEDSAPESEPTTHRQSSRLHGQPANLSNIDFNKIPGHKDRPKRKSASLGEDQASATPGPSKRQRTPQSEDSQKVEVRVPLAESEEIRNKEPVLVFEEDEQPVLGSVESHDRGSPEIPFMGRELRLAEEGRDESEEEESSEDDADGQVEILEITESPDEESDHDGQEEAEPEPRRNSRPTAADNPTSSTQPTTRPNLPERSLVASKQSVTHQGSKTKSQAPAAKYAGVPQRRRPGRPPKTRTEEEPVRPPNDPQTIVVRQRTPSETRRSNSRALVRTGKALSKRGAHTEPPQVDEDEDDNFDGDQGSRSDYDSEQSLDDLVNESGSDSEEVLPEPPLERIKHFIKTGRISGKCQTREGDTIWRACRSARQLFEMDEVGIDDITSTLEELYEMLNTFTSTDNQSVQLKRKRDAFAYLFRSLGQVIMALHDCTPSAPIDTSEGELVYDTLKIATRFIQQILLFKSALAPWKVGSLKREGVLVIQPATQGLITPLRELVEEYTRDLRQMDRRRKEERQRQAQLEEQARRLEEEKHKAQVLKVQKERLKRWQDLHIARMKCEPDPELHDHLRFRKMPDSQELDANGERFERVAVFTTRTGPPGNLGDGEGLDWEDEEKIALLDGLREFVGTYSPPICF